MHAPLDYAAAKQPDRGTRKLATWMTRAAALGGVLGLALWLAVGHGDEIAPNDVTAPSAVASGAMASPGFVRLSDAVTPVVELGVQQGDTALAVTLRVGRLGSPQPEVPVAPPLVTLGVATAGAAPQRLATPGDATSRADGDVTVYTFLIPRDRLAAPNANGQVDWSTLRLALSVAWPGGPDGRPQREERFLHVGGPRFGTLAENAAEWQLFDLEEYERTVSDRQNQLEITFTQPVEGRATVVINDADGNRVRNLISGIPVSAGAQRVTWDGLDDDGRLVAPGTYTWSSAHHPGITPAYKMNFNNGGVKDFIPFGSNHSRFMAATANADTVFLGAPLTEGGFATIATTPDGTWLRGYDKINGTGIEGVALAADEKYLYIANDGLAWGQRVDRKDPAWTIDVAITLTRYLIADEKPVDFPGGTRFAKLETHAWGPGAPEADARLRKRLSLSGMVVLGDRLYVASRAAQAVLVVNKATGEVLSQWPLAEPGDLAVRGDRLLCVSGDRIVELNPADGTTRDVFAGGQVEPSGLTADPASGRVYVSDAKTHTVWEVGVDGAVARQLGVPGGAYQGAFVADRLVRPLGLAVVNGKLWVCENRENPKRATGWDLTTGHVVHQLDGNPPYGGPGAGFDPADPTRWLALRSGWTLDFATGEATCTSVLQRDEGHLGGAIDFPLHYKFVRQDGRIFLLGMAKAELISELMPDGSVRDLAVVGNTQSFEYACGWKPPQAYTDAVLAAFPNPKDREANALRSKGMLWIDRNGDGACQAEEFQFTTTTNSFGGGYWGHDQHDLTLRYPTVVGGKPMLVVLQPDGFLPGGAPNYPDLNAAVAAATPLAIDRISGETWVDRFGDLFFNSDPWMMAFAPNGRLLWRYPNLWSNVHGSHRAPLPETGVMQGNLFALGTAPLDATSDVFMMLGNHGRCFLLTSDGLYLDEIFTDVRVSRAHDANLIGGEPFGGVFGKADNGTYYLQTGGSGTRIYTIEGLDRVTRATGSISVTPAALAAAERQHTRALATATSAGATGPQGASSVATSPVSWDRDGRFPVQVEMSVEGNRLRLQYAVEDDSPWVNHGKDWTLLFKTGDCLDFQFAADPGAPAKRREPAPGDRRLLIAPFDEAGVAADSGIVVLYDYNVPGTTTPQTFASPWRSATVDRVTRLTDATVKVERKGSRYVATVTVSLADLGLTALTAPAAQQVRGDLGVIYGDSDGTVNILRSYWANPATALVNDVPGETYLAPEMWGTIRLGKIAARAGHLMATGTLGNSGVTGATLVRAVPGDVRGLGVVRDSLGGLWDRAGAGTLNRYAADGRLIATYAIPTSTNGLDDMAIVDDRLILLLGGSLYRLATTASPGTAPEPLNQTAKYLAHRAVGLRLPIADDANVSWLDVGTGAVEVMQPNPHGDNLRGLDVLPDGTVKLLSNTMVAGERPRYLRDGWYSNGWHSTVYRADPDLHPAPGVVLGGNSGYFIGHVDENPEIINGRGLAWLGGDVFAAGGQQGVMHLLAWDAAERRFNIVRRIGALTTAHGLGLDSRGRIFCNSGAWDWDGPSDAPQVRGLSAIAVGQAAWVDPDTMVTVAVQYGDRPRLFSGGLDKELKIWGEKVPPFKPAAIGAVVVRDAGKPVLLLVDKAGTASRYRLSERGEPYGVLPPATLAAKTPLTTCTSLAVAPDGSLLVAADGAVVVFARDAGVADSTAWHETARFTGWGDTPDAADAAFGKRLWITADDSRLWVSDEMRHRVVCLDITNIAGIADATAPRLLGSFGLADQRGDDMGHLDRPTRLSASGDRCVVFDSANQRLMKLQMQPDETTVAAMPAQ